MTAKGVLLLVGVGLLAGAALADVYFKEEFNGEPYSAPVLG